MLIIDQLFPSQQPSLFLLSDDGGPSSFHMKSITQHKFPQYLTGKYANYNTMSW